jgi:DNA-directed RNA polymerase subunit RPC12/RpoP
MTIALWCPTDGFGEYKWYALIHNGKVVRGEYNPPHNLDLADEEVLLARYTGPGTVASKLDGLDIEALQQAETTLEEPRLDELRESRHTYRCTMCGAAPEEPQSEGDEQRWIECPECGKDRFFEPTTS